MELLQFHHFCNVSFLYRDGSLVNIPVFSLDSIVCLPLPADVVFFIYLYQRWIYRVDPNRVNEFGTSGVDHAQNNSEGAAPVADAAAASITDKPEGEKKND